MSFKIATIADAIGRSDAQADLFRGLVQALIDHGASRKELEELLVDAKGDKKLFGFLAKKVMGKLWELVDGGTFYLGPIDFDRPPLEFLRSSAELYVHGTYEKSLLGNRWVESKPKRNCQYRLVQSVSDSRWHQFQNPQLQSFAEYAGWRELVYFASKLNKGDLKHCKVFGLGTPELGPRDEVWDSFFYLCEEHHGIEMSAFSSNGSRRLNQSCFHLVRVYNS